MADNLFSIISSAPEGVKTARFFMQRKAIYPALMRYFSRPGKSAKLMGTLISATNEK